MAHELKQGSSQPTPTASFVDDRTGNRSLHMQANARVITTFVGQIASSSASLVSLGGDTTASLPGGAVPTHIRIYSPSTSPTVSVGIDTTSTYFVNSAAIAGGSTVLPTVANLYTALATLPTGVAHALTGTTNKGFAVYLEIDYYLPDPA